MKSPRVIPTLDVLGQRALQIGPRGPGSRLEELALRRRKEALGHGVVPALAGPPHRELHAVGLRQLGKSHDVYCPQSEW